MVELSQSLTREDRLGKFNSELICSETNSALSSRKYKIGDSFCILRKSPDSGYFTVTIEVDDTKRELFTFDYNGNLVEAEAYKEIAASDDKEVEYETIEAPEGQGDNCIVNFTKENRIPGKIKYLADFL